MPSVPSVKSDNEAGSGITVNVPRKPCVVDWPGDVFVNTTKRS